MTQIKNQKGFSIFEGIIIVVALVAIGAAGYYAYQARQDKTDYSVTAPHKAATASPQNTSTDATPAASYLDVKEWGVKFKLTSGYADMYYVIQSASDGDFAYMATQSLVKQAPECAPDRTAQAALGRYSNQASVPQNETLIGKIGNYYYTSSTANGMCTQPGQTSAQDDATKLRGDFTGMAATLQAD